MTNKKKKKEVEHYRKSYIRVRLGNKPKKKTEKRLRAAQQFVYHKDRNMRDEEFTAKRKKKNKNIWGLDYYDSERERQRERRY